MLSGFFPFLAVSPLSSDSPNRVQLALVEMCSAVVCCGCTGVLPAAVAVTPNAAIDVRSVAKRSAANDFAGCRDPETGICEVPHFKSDVSILWTRR